MFCGKQKVMAALALLALAVSAGAQARKRDVRRADEKPAGVTHAVEQPPAASYLSGEANVAVSGNQNPVVRLGLSPNGVTMIEFPAADRFFALHPGNSDLVT